MLAAQTRSTAPTALRSSRRTSDSWRDDRRARPNRAAAERDVCTLPISTARRAEPADALETRMQRINKRWSHTEREYRRLQALRKQEELMLMLAGDDLESLLRIAVADGEQPVCLPEFAGMDD